MELEVDLFNHAMNGDSNEVVKIYNDHPEVHESKINKSGDTALHLAVSDGQEDYVRLLVAIIRDEENKRAGEQPQPLAQAPAPTPAALRVENEKGNTPLHLAAALGSFEMCYCIASKYPDLIGIRNKEQNNPLFIAAQYGEKDAFFCLDNILSDNDKHKYKRESYYRGSNGDTFLHVALNRDYFDLAFQIICRYGELVYYYNETGFTPLHILATKPYAFKSASRLSWFNKIIYHCTYVDELKEYDGKEKMEEEKKKVTKLEQELEKDLEVEQILKHLKPKLEHLPENYETCVGIFGLVRTVVGVLLRKKEDLLIPKKKADPQEQTDMESQVHEHDSFPPNYQVWCAAVEVISNAILIIFGRGTGFRVSNKKKQHAWALQIVNKLLSMPNTYGYLDSGQNPQQKQGSGTLLDEPDATTGNILKRKQVDIYSLVDSENDQKKEGQKNPSDFDVHKNEKPILIAVKYGIIEIVDKILKIFPMAIHDMNSNGKNVVLLAVENRQSSVYQYLLGRIPREDNIFNKVDKDGNSALHLAAKFGEYHPHLIPGAALQMQWEIKWFEFVKYSMRPHFFAQYNKNNETAKYIFTSSHKDLVRLGGEWLAATSQSCSVVAAAVATVAFTAATTVPGGIKQETGTPTLGNEPAFNIFAFSSLIALCFSVTALLMFLAIHTSRHHENDFRTKLPGKLFFGLTSLFISTVSMLITFCAGHFFVLKDKLKSNASPVYAVMCLLVTLFAVDQFPWYFGLLWATLKNVPGRSYRVDT